MMSGRSVTERGLVKAELGSQERNLLGSSVPPSFAPFTPDVSLIEPPSMIPQTIFAGFSVPMATMDSAS